MNVFVARIYGAPQNVLLVIPVSPEAAIPAQYRSGRNYFATVDTGDHIFGAVDGRAIEVEIASAGMPSLKPEAPDRR